MDNLLLVLLAFGLVLLNGFFVAAEFGMVKLRSTRIQKIKEDHGARGYILYEVHKHLDAYLSACQLGITLASLGLGWIGEPAFAHLLKPIFQLLGITSPEVLTISAFMFAFIIISFLHIVVGELMPKSLAIRQSEKVSVWTAIPLYGFYWLMFPAIWALNHCSNYLLRKAGLDKIHESEAYHSTDEIKMILSSSHLHGELTVDESEIIENTLDLADLCVTEVMRPRNEMIMLSLNDPIQNILQKIKKHRYSRYPIYDTSKNEVVGIIHIKDLFSAFINNEEIDNIEKFIRPILKVNSKLPAMDLLRKFREGMPHFSLIYHGRENLLGFVTLDNLLHVMIGKIKDEFHRTHDDWFKNSDGSFTVKGECSLYSLERALGIDITLSEEEAEIDTISGLIIARLGEVPKNGVKIPFKEFEAIIEDVEGPYIRKIKILSNKINT